MNPSQATPITGLCDSHVHVFDPARFPYMARRAYTPPPADVRALEQHLGTLAATRVVLVQPSVYGDDNACLLDALQVLGSERARGIAVLDPERSNPSQIAQFHDAGVRGLRLNLNVSGDDLTSARTLVRKTAALLPASWHLQIHASLSLIAALLEEFGRLERPVVLDHFAGGLTSEADSPRQMEKLLHAIGGLPLHVKLSAPYRLWPGIEPRHLADLALAFASAAPERVVWGSDWPHTGGSGSRTGARDAIEPFRAIDSSLELQTLLASLPSTDLRHRLLVANPAALYGFPP